MSDKIFRKVNKKSYVGKIFYSIFILKAKNYGRENTEFYGFTGIESPSLPRITLGKIVRASCKIRLSSR